MTNNQEWFNREYSKEVEEIEITDDDFEGQLVITDYPNLKNLYLRDVENIDKITLKNLGQLQEFTIRDCGTKELVIANCPQIKKLNIENNFLTSLEFLANLENLEISELKADGNSFQGLAKKFWDLKKSREDLKKQVSLISKKTQQSTTSKPINTKELVLSLEKEFKDKKAKINELEIKLNDLDIKEKKDQLKRLRSEFVEKKLMVYNFPFIKQKQKKEKVQKSLENYLISIEDLLIDSSNRSALTLKEEKGEYLKKGKFELTELLEKLSEKQKEISLREIQKKQITNELKEEYRKIEEDGLQREIDRIEKLIHSGEGSEPDSKLLKKLKNELESLRTKLVIRKTENYLEAKKNYLDLRLEIAKGLQECCDELNRINNIETPKKEAIIKGISNILGIITVRIPTKVGDIEVNFSKLAEAFGAIVDYHGAIFAEEREKEFQRYLENNENIVNSFKENYGLLTKTLEENKNLPISSKIIKDLELEDTKGSTRPLKTFEIRYEKICSIAENWKRESLDLNEMKDKVDSVIKILSNLDAELNTEKNRLESIKEENPTQTNIEIPSK
jgi:hypothetical protein